MLPIPSLNDVLTPISDDNSCGDLTTTIPKAKIPSKIKIGLDVG
ncbi:hypothetical protein [Spiroplasma endosymbiont of Megaselia nigra]|nr:hypothetical protein [Spiroplasma endosymbiont of Megaselia nigra]